MPYDRRTARIVLALSGLVGVALSTGCARWSNLRSSAGPASDRAPVGSLTPETEAAPPGSPAPVSAKASAPSGRDPVASPSRTNDDPRPTSGGPVLDSPPAEASGATPAVATPPPTLPSAGTEASPSPSPAVEPKAPEPPSTPLLDAEIRRAEAVTRQHLESLDAPEPAAPVVPAAEAPTPVDDRGSQGPSRPSTTSGADPAAMSVPGVIPAPMPMSADPTPIPPLLPVPFAGPEPEPAPRPSAVVAAVAPARRPVPAPEPAATVGGTASGRMTDGPRIAPTAAGGDPPTPADPAPKDERDGRPPLEIASLRLCTRVQGFGQIDSVDPGSIRPGRRLLVYWEMSGLDYRPRGDAFVSRLAAHLELCSEADGRVVWEHAPGAAEDICPRRRQDYYASYPVELPGTLAPGNYRLRLIQTDLIGDRAASRELPFTVVR